MWGGGWGVQPLHAPLRQTQDNLKFKLPSSDYRTTSRYVTPGVILMVNKQIETEDNGHDKQPFQQNGQMICILRICCSRTRIA